MRPWFVIPALVVSSLAFRASSDTRVFHHVGHRLEVRRIQAHFDSVLSELNAERVSGLSPEQHTARTRVIRHLVAYRDRALFPHNYDFPGQAVPYFIDRYTSVRCAVAYLMDATGAGALVTQVAAHNNNVLVPDLAGNTAFIDWLHANGLTLSEAARIQVPYMGDGNPIVTALGSTNGVYAVGTALVTLPAAAAAFWNARGNANGHRAVGTILGLSTGALSMALGGAALRDPMAPRYVSPVSLAAGAVGGWLAVRGFTRHRFERSRQREAHRVARVHVAPFVSPRTHGSGLAVSLTF